MAQELIVSDPQILGGKPCVRGTRLSVEFLLELAASGATQAHILTQYPQLTPDGLAVRARSHRHIAQLRVEVEPPFIAVAERQQATVRVRTRVAPPW